LIYGFISQSYWAKGIPRKTVQKSLDNSIVFGVYELSENQRSKQQRGFARVITDKATFAYLADVFVIESHRGLGLSKQLMSAVVAHPDLQGLRKFMLTTNDAHGLYQQYGFTPVEQPELLLQIARPDIYGE
jgi:N-acetylglutamate synthase-like GNAT family acetyltransferase